MDDPIPKKEDSIIEDISLGRDQRLFELIIFPFINFLHNFTFFLITLK